jgi:cellulose synthase/poly-beta-1,6-N-acetylglucosamine synthase-like glycosyltransferase
VTLVTAIWIISLLVFAFSVLYALTTFSLIGLSLHEAVHQKLERGETFRPLHRPLRPGITLITPAYNEEKVIVANASSLLAVDYDPLEVVIVDDGSTDATPRRLVDAFDMIELPVGDRFQLETKPVERIYVSRSDPRLRLLCKQNGGRADAVNAGINLAREDLIALTDADSLLDRDALARVVEVFSADPDRVVAVGGTIRTANGCVIENGEVVEARVPQRGTEASQLGEYLRASFGARIAWAKMNGLMIISGAFGVFRRDLVHAIGGLSSDTLGEDMELTMRLHERLRPSQPDARISFAPDANCWTEIPPGLGPLRGQRIRWHVGLLDNIRLHRRMILRRRFGAVGVFAFPYSILFEVIAPVLQAAGIVVTVALLAFGEIAWEYALAFVIAMFLAGQLQTAGAILIEDIGFGRYRVRDLMLIACWSLLEIFWFRPLTAIWRTWATLLFVVGRRPGWGKIPRGAALAEPPVEITPAPLPR